MRPVALLAVLTVADRRPAVRADDLPLPRRRAAQGHAGPEQHADPDPDERAEGAAWPSTSWPRTWWCATACARSWRRAPRPTAWPRPPSSRPPSVLVPAGGSKSVSVTITARASRRAPRRGRPLPRPHPGRERPRRGRIASLGALLTFTLSDDDPDHGRRSRRAAAQRDDAPLLRRHPRQHRRRARGRQGRGRDPRRERPAGRPGDLRSPRGCSPASAA